ncbi:MAG: hypothetical protein NW220_15925 [Leptolyngbyaceae cyanobacterium bins.349]|nr:hypothetical protein [Leptolyngbyaceae cyanobacterium bins.349]
MALKDSWLLGRQQRQQQRLERQQAVQQVLLDVHQTRQQMSATLHHQLTQFRAGLTQQDQLRRADFQQFQTALQQDYQVLQQDIAECLAMLAADRSLLAQQQSVELEAFHQDLHITVRSLREALQTDMASLKTDTQTFLTNCQQQRFQVNAKTQLELAWFMEHLRSNVHHHLTQMKQIRHQSAIQTQQALEHSRAQRTTDVQALLANLTEFRTTLRQFRQSLSDAVWGQSGSHGSKMAQTSGESRVSAIPPATPNGVKLGPTKAAVSKNTVPKRTPIPKAAPKSVVKVTSMAQMAASSQGLSIAPTASSPIATTSPAELAFEKEVYTFLHQHQGARLTQIESALKINRFQAVDALRSLIKKGLITQRDRVYLTQAPG